MVGAVPSPVPCGFHRYACSLLNGCRFRRLATADAGHGILFLWICDLRRDDLPVKGERRLVEIVERYGRAEVAADVEAVVCGEAERGGDRYTALRHDLAIDLQRDVQWGAPLGHGQLRLDFNLHLASRQLVFRLDLRALNLKQIGCVTKHA